MSNKLEGVRGELESLFGPWVSFDRIERKLYSHDIGVLPGLIKPLTGTGIAGAVVQPGEETDIIKLIEIAERAGVTITPRGAGSSGYGGAVPAEGAIVVETRRMAGIVGIDRDAMTAKVKTGTVWKDLEEELGETGLASRLYPSSAPSSTVGGWLAQGGTGFGAYEYGWFKDNVVKARVVLPNGEIKEFAGTDLDLISDANGITGIISEVTIRIRPLTAEKVFAVAFTDETALETALGCLARTNAPLWSAGFINPTGVRLKKQLPPKTHHGHPIDTHIPELPETYIALFACDTEQAGKAEHAINDAIQLAGGAMLGDDVAEHEWSERFNPMKAKRIGPSLIAAEFVVPVEKLGSVLSEINTKIAHPFVIEGTVVKGGEVVILGFIPHDERSFAFTLAYGLSITAAKIAKKFGGRIYTTGIYFRREAPAILGKERLEKLTAFKHTIDPSGYFNPGKVIGGGLLSTVMGLVESFDPLVRAVGNLAKAPVGERFAREVNGIPGDLAWYAYACAQCGYCEQGCTQFYGRGWQSHSPRGKWYFLKEVIEGREKITQDDIDKFMVCTTCERCDISCQLDLPIEPSWMKLRGKFIAEDKKMTFPAFEMMAASAHKERNIWAAYSQDRDAWLEGEDEIKSHIRPKADIAYFAGCTASYVEDDIAKASTTLLGRAGIDFAYLGKEEACCGIPMLVCGRWDIFEEILRHNVSKMKETGAETVVTSCPACWLAWNTVYPEWAQKLGIEYPFKAKHYSQVLADKIAAGELTFDHEVPMKVTFHDSCHIGRAGGVYEPPRDLIKAIPGVELVEMKHNRENGLCCGSVLTLIGETPVAPVLGKRKLDEAAEAGAEAIIALCPCCQFQMRVAADKNGVDMPVKDLASLAAKGLGVDLPDSTPEALYQWSVFEKMIYLMKPEPMVDLMATLMPQLVEAMPGPFPTMMRIMAKIPGALEAMRPIMPKMMPIMLPGMMPKVMPAMIKEVRAYMGEIPDYMSAQFDDLLPTTMEALMPNMLPMIASGVTDKMIACLKHGCNKQAQAVSA
ncbi:MAG TPA: FAD-binding and (Fe-S)-binding domain-containing protein [Candidatus Aquicultor sp.]|jgi:Fe-S oxidoreductase/FAD/FMN-containing dehydrogenase